MTNLDIMNGNLSQHNERGDNKKNSSPLECFLIFEYLPKNKIYMDASIILYKTLIHWMIWIDFISRKQEIMDHFDLNFFARLLFLRNARSCCRDEKFLKDTMIYKFQQEI